MCHLTDVSPPRQPDSDMVPIFPHSCQLPGPETARDTSLRAEFQLSAGGQFPSCVGPKSMLSLDENIWLSGNLPERVGGLRVHSSCLQRENVTCSGEDGSHPAWEGEAAEKSSVLLPAWYRREGLRREQQGGGLGTSSGPRQRSPCPAWDVFAGCVWARVHTRLTALLCSLPGRSLFKGVGE